jgi:hypothetical protein
VSKAGVLLLVSALLFALPLGVAMAETLRHTMDDNGDGKPDQWYTLNQGELLEYEADRNFDGLVDYKAEFAGGDRLLYEEFDFNFDGEMDDFYYFEEGLLVRQEIDTNFDREIDMWIYLDEGIYVKRIERDLDFDGKIDRVKDYEKK